MVTILELKKLNSDESTNLPKDIQDKSQQEHYQSNPGLSDSQILTRK